MNEEGAGGDGDIKKERKGGRATKVGNGWDGGDKGGIDGTKRTRTYLGRPLELLYGRKRSSAMAFVVEDDGHALSIRRPLGLEETD